MPPLGRIVRVYFCVGAIGGRKGLLCGGAHDQHLEDHCVKCLFDLRPGCYLAS